MTYRIEFHDGQNKIGSRMEPGDLEAAKAHAQEGLILHKATSARIVDTEGREIWATQLNGSDSGAPQS